MTQRLVDRIPFKKIVTVLAVVCGVSFGLCGVTPFLFSGSSRLVESFMVLELVAMGLSLAGLVLTLLVFVTLSIFSGFEEKVPQENDTRSDKNE